MPKNIGTKNRFPRHFLPMGIDPGVFATVPLVRGGHGFLRRVEEKSTKGSNRPKAQR